MPEITITISIPEGTTINVGGLEAVLADTAKSSTDEPPDHTGRYWKQYLSTNGRKVFGQAARTERFSGPGYTLEDLADALSIDYPTIKSYHRSTGRAAKRWRRDTGLREPIRLEPVDYAPKDAEDDAWRTQYKLPDLIAEEIAELEMGE